jgi:hypothetical protein
MIADHDLLRGTPKKTAFATKPAYGLSLSDGKKINNSHTSEEAQCARTTSGRSSKTVARSSMAGAPSLTLTPLKYTRIRAGLV